MTANAKVLAATLGTLAVAMLTVPALAQQQPTGPAAPPDASVQGPPQAPLPPQVEPPQTTPSQAVPSQAAPSHAAPAQAAPAQAAPVRPRSAVVTANVNLRSGPVTDAEIITAIPGGSTVQVGDCNGEWCAVSWNGRDGFAIARNLDTSGRRTVRRYRPQPYYEGGPPVVYGPPVYYPPPVVYAPGYYYGPRYYYGRRWGGGWGRRW